MSKKEICKKDRYDILLNKPGRIVTIQLPQNSEKQEVKKYIRDYVAGVTGLQTTRYAGYMGTVGYAGLTGIG
jgi:hypothetical protein